MQSIIYIALAGAAGAVTRYGVGVLANRTLGDHFAFGTLLVNVLGCLAIGVLVEAERSTDLVTHPLRMLLMVGFLGAFTTFSAFGYETLRFVQNGTPNLAMLNLSANIVLGLGAVWVGFLLGRAAFPAA